METSIQSNLCKGLRACGIPKSQTYQILNEVQKWYDASGPEWTNSRIKDLRQWYETCLTGKPNPPVWFKHSEEGYPVGIWKWVFNQKPAKALGILSLNTVFYEKELSVAQEEKFLKGLSGNQSYGDITPYVSNLNHHPMFKSTSFKAMPPIQFPTVFDMTGSVPIHDGQETVRPDGKLGLALSALQRSWESCPKVTFEFLDKMDLLGYMPENVVFDNNNFVSLGNNLDRRIGKVSVLQQPQLKARVVGNPNRVLQKTLDPLKEVYMTTARKLSSDCTHDQESGVRWVQAQLKQGKELAGSDLTSASDLLEISRCLALVDAAFGFRKISKYEEWEQYFYEVCREPWWCPELNREVKWQQGTVLGTGPSFGLLTLTNNVLGCLAARRAAGEGKLEFESEPLFRVIGDDIIMRSEMLPYYNELVQLLGGEINFSKTLVSDRVAEFAGRVITPDSVYLKAIKYNEPSDNSFMSYVAQLGDQAKFFLRPKQRQVYDFFKSVPGIVVDGPWMPDSYGESLSQRYQWYLEEVEPVLKTAEPDLKLEDYELTLLKAELSLIASGQIDKEGYDVPVFDIEGYLPSTVTPAFKVGGDPRLTDGKTLLDVLQKHIQDGRIQSFESWKKSHSGDVGNDSSEHDREIEHETTDASGSSVHRNLRSMDYSDR